MRTHELVYCKICTVLHCSEPYASTATAWDIFTSLNLKQSQVPDKKNKLLLRNY